MNIYKYIYIYIYIYILYIYIIKSEKKVKNMLVYIISIHLWGISFIFRNVEK